MAPLTYKLDDTRTQHSFSCPLQCQQCTATTKRGTRCSKRVCIGVPLCWQHLLSGRHLRIKKSGLTTRGQNGSPVSVGVGLWAMKPGAAPNDVVFRAGDIVTAYDGEVVTQQVKNQRYTTGDITAPYMIGLGQGRYEDGACVRGAGTVANHRAAPNAKLSVSRAGRARIVALKPIRHNTEVFVSYGRNYKFQPHVKSRTTRLARG